MKRNLILLLTLSINHLYSIDVGILKEANKLGFEYVDLCEQSETPMVKETLNVWVEHHLPIKTKSQVSK